MWEKELFIQKEDLAFLISRDDCEMNCTIDTNKTNYHGFLMSQKNYRDIKNND